MKSTYTLDIAGVKRELQLCPLNEQLKIAAFILFGDVELTRVCAKELLKKAPEHDIIITSESKGIPLAFEMAGQSKNNYYVVARKSKKLYMQDGVSVNYGSSITTGKAQEFYLSKHDADLLNGKKVAIVDDVVSTGESVAGLVQLAEKAGGNVVKKLFVLAEGSAKDRDDVEFLAHIPLL